MNILRVLCFTYLIWCSQYLYSQHESNLGRFYVEYERGCFPVTVNVTQQDGLGDVSRQYFYEAGLVETVDTFYTYANPGIYRIVQFIGEDVEPKTDTLVFEVLPPTPPEFEVFQCSPNEATIEIVENTYDYYVIRLSSSDSVVWRSGDGIISNTYPTTNGIVEVEGFYDNSFNGCGIITRNFNLNSLSPAQVLDAKVARGCLSNYFLNLSLNILPLTKYEVLYRQGNDGYQVIYTGSLTNSIALPISFDEQSDSYCIQVNTLNDCNGTKFEGFERCEVIANNQQPGLQKAFASYSGTRIAIQVDSLTSTEIALKRKSGNASFTQIAQISARYQDQIPSQNRAFQYQLIERDTCGNFVDSISISAPFVKLLDKNRITSTITFEVAPPKNNLGTPEVSLLFYNEDSTIIEETVFSESPALPPGVGPQQTMRIKYHYPVHLVDVYSNKISAEYEVNIFVPKAFTPNGDGLNDRLVLFGLPSNDFEIQIFDRWGRTMISTAENPVWDGRANRKEAEEGTYSYRLRFKQLNGQLKTQVGTFVLLRK